MCVIVYCDVVNVQPHFNLVSDSCIMCMSVQDLLSAIHGSCQIYQDFAQTRRTICCWGCLYDM